MRRVLSFISREGLQWPLVGGILAGWVVWNYYRRGAALPLVAACLVLFAIPYFTRYSVALRYSRVRRLLVWIFMWLGVLSVLSRLTAFGHFGSFVFFGYCALAFGCVFWAASDPAYALIDWLSFPTEYGWPPDEIRLLDRRIVSWPDDTIPSECWLFRYRYDNEWDVGFTGPFTFSLMGAGLDGWPVEDIYAAYRDWSSQDGIRDGIRELREGNSAGEHPDSLKGLDEAIRLNPKDAHSHSLRSLVWLEKGVFENALRDANEAIRLEPDDVLLYGLRASVYLEMQDVDAAMRDFDTAIRIDPTSRIAYYGRGCALRDKGEFSKALDDFTKAIELTPEAPESYNQRAWLLATATDAQFRDGPRAVEFSYQGLRIVGLD